jgi:hypothetical protein
MASVNTIAPALMTLSDLKPRTIGTRTLACAAA